MGPLRETPATPSPADAGMGQWARAYADDLKRFLAKRRIVESEIKDICQEVYLRLLRFHPAEVIHNPQAYLFRVAANVAHDFKLRRARWAPVDVDTQLAQEPADAPTPEETAESASRARALQRVMAGLPPLPRAALALQLSEDLTYDEIAVRLGATRRTVKRAVARGYALMREGLQEELT